MLVAIRSTATYCKSVFLTAKPTPRYLRSSTDLACQKNVKSFSLMEPWPAWLKSCNISLKTKEFVVYDGSFSCIASVANVSFHISSHNTDVPTSQFKSESLFSFLFFSWLILRIRFAKPVNPHAPIKEGKLWRNNIWLAEGCSALGRR